MWKILNNNNLKDIKWRLKRGREWRLGFYVVRLCELVDVAKWATSLFFLIFLDEYNMLWGVLFIHRTTTTTLISNLCKIPKQWLAATPENINLSQSTNQIKIIIIKRKHTQNVLPRPSKKHQEGSRPKSDVDNVVIMRLSKFLQFDNHCFWLTKYCFFSTFDVVFYPFGIWVTFHMTRRSSSSAYLVLNN